MDAAGDGESVSERTAARAARLDVKRAAAAARKEASKAAEVAASGGRAGAGAGASSASLGAHLLSKSMSRVADGMATLDAKKSATIDAVTAVRLDADTREQSRRAQEEERVQDRLHRLREEAAASGRANAAIQLKWADILERNLPQELATELATQKEACNAVIASSDALIAQLQGEMRAKDEEYVRLLQQQRDDIEQLITRMADQFDELSKAYEGELAAMEGVFMQERDELLAANKREIDSLFEARRAMESRFVEEKLAREEAYARELTDMQAADAENYQKLKVKLETDVQILEQQLENMKFTYLLNTEKLEYNYRVLTERDSENKQTLAAQKQRLARLRAALSKVQSEYEASDARFKAKNAALTEEYTRITRQYRDLQAKFRHFEAADALRYNEIVSMHESDMSTLVDRLVSADRVITEQLLGWAWTPPTAPPVAAAGATMNMAAGGGGGGSPLVGVSAGGSPPSGASASGASATRAGVPANGVGSSDDDNVGSAAVGVSLEAGSVSTVGSAALSGGGGVGASSTSPSRLPSFTGGVGSDASASGGAAPVDPAMLRHTLRLLLSSCGSFLLDAATQASAAECETAGKPDMADMLRGNALLHTMGATTPALVASLVASVRDAIAAALLQSRDESGSGAGTRGGAGGSLLDGAGGAEALAEADRVLASDALSTAALLPPTFSALRTVRAWIDEARHHPLGGMDDSTVDAAASGVLLPSTLGSGAAAASGSMVAPDVLRKLDSAIQSQGKEQGSVSTATTWDHHEAAPAAAARSEQQEADHWRGIASTIPAEKIRIWKALDRGLQQYKSVLTQRRDTAVECQRLEAENAELRRALAVYLDPTFGNLAVPPVHTVRLTPAVTADPTLAATIGLSRVGGGGTQQMSASP